MSRERTAFLDLLINTLREHEKSLDDLVSRLEKIVNRIDRMLKDEE